MLKKRRRNARLIVSYIMLTFGSILAAFALETFLIPNTILDGGVTGISIIVSKLTDLPVSGLVLVLNIPFVYIGYKSLGKEFLMSAVYSMILFSLSLSVFQYIEPVTEQMLLATVYGGILLGIGVGIVLRYGGCVDGTESVALVISKKTTFSVGQIVLIFNIVIFSVAGAIFGIDRAMYSLLTYFITSKVIDFVSDGLEQVKAALIVTDKGTDMAHEIYRRLGRTVTTIRGRGLISGDKEVMYVVINRIEISELRSIADDMDEEAFITILDVSDIIGQNIKYKHNSSRKKIRFMEKERD